MLLKPRWMKLARDAELMPGRTAMMILAIAAGVFGLATMLGSYSILTREIRQNYLATNPASATLKIDNIDAALVQAIRNFPGIAAAQASAKVNADIQMTDGRSQALNLMIVDDFKDMRINSIFPENGAWPPAPGTLLLEKDSLKKLKLNIGDVLQLKMADGSKRQITISGSARDPGVPVPSMSAFAYAAPETLASLGIKDGMHDLKISVSEKAFDIDAIEQQASKLALWLQQQGHVVERIRIPPPGEHPHQLIMTSMLGMLLVFSGIALLLSAVLTASIIDSMLAQQIRQIGVMKTIGARFSQIMSLYLGFVFIIGVLATCLGAPAGLAAGRAFSQLILGNVLNFTMSSGEVPGYVYLVLVFAGVIVPLCMAAVPVSRAGKVSAHIAMTDFGSKRKFFTENAFGQWLYHLPGLNRSITMSLLYSLRNSFRSRGRLLLTLALLATAGAMFISSLNVRKASQEHLIEAATERHYDLELYLGKPADKAGIISIIAAVPGVNKVEAWSSSSVARHRPDGLNIERTYPDGGHGSLNVMAIPDGSELISLSMQSGLWLSEVPANAGDALDTVVLNNKALESFPRFAVGDTITLGVRDKAASLRVVGIARQKMTGAMAYVSPATYAKLSSQAELYKSFRVVLDTHDAKTIDARTRQIEAALTRQGIRVSASITETMLRQEVDDHFDLLVNALLFISILMALVGVLGLGSSMSSNVAERTREFGIMRSIGASPGVVIRSVMAEGLLIALMSFGIAVAMALPLSAGISAFLGNLLFDEAFPLVISQKSLWIWLLIVSSGAALATAYPAWKASRLSIHASFAQ
ncbi:ABC transporter permease [Undibacterium sp. Di27W]|uniref:ABC transporter permease n=1 Tax=Undibacterium sp. Di27W TaxID=3413036 RepID=UPI003BF35548